MKYLVPALALSLLVMYANHTYASPLVFTFGEEYSESGAVLTGDVVVTLSDAANGDVYLTVDSTGITGNEFITGLYLNFNPDYDVSGLTIGEDATDPAATLMTGTDAYQAGSDGLYDLLFDWGENHPRFFGGMIETFVISHIALDIVAQDFNFLSTPAGGNGPFHAVLRAQGFGTNDNSGWFSPTANVPEPGVFWLLAGSIVLMTLLGARHKKNAAMPV